MEILSNADQVILSTSPEPTSVMDAYAALKLLNGTGFIGRKNIIVNKSEDKNTADITFLNLKTAVDHFLKIEIKLLGFVSNDAAVSRSIMAQVPLVKQSPDSQIAKQINDLAANLSKNIQVANIQQAG